MSTPPRPAADTLIDELTRQRPYLVQFARRQLRDDMLVEDVVQETLLAAWQGVAAFEHRATLRTWLTGILRRRIVDAVRASRRGERGAPLAAPVDEDTIMAHGEPDGAHARPGDEPVDWIDPSRRLEGREFLAALAQCLDGLPEHAVRIFSLRTLDGLSNEQAAQAMGLNPRRATVLLHRTLGRLRSGLTPHTHALVAA